ncbi:radical SAM protein [Sulfurisphaera ohwakuensis]|uniref:Radical SAM protein n=2 Tax=Sulfurisphaera ohwakuensis TaxID=69656 RepID=A0A650CGC5_SULOH|nr:radical SAM protein [Sulfurisphaera ohwakuensis]
MVAKVMIYILDDIDSLRSNSIPNDFKLVAINVKTFIKYNSEIEKLLKNNRIFKLYILFNDNDIINFNSYDNLSKMKDTLIKISKIKTLNGFKNEFVFMISQKYDIEAIRRILFLSESRLYNFAIFVINMKSIKEYDLEMLLTSDVINNNLSEVILVDDKTVWPGRHFRFVKQISNEEYLFYKNPFFIDFKGKLTDLISLEALKKIYQYYASVSLSDSFRYWNFKGIVIELTYKCNFSCDHCYVSSSPQRGEILELNKIYKILEEALNLPFIDKKVHIAGGEVTLFWDKLVELIKFSKSLGYIVTLVTNGSWALNESKVKELKELKIDEIELSLTPYHLKFWNNKDNILKMLNNLKKYNLNFFIRFLTSKSNKIYDLYKLLGNELLGIPIISSPVLRLGRALSNLPPNEFYGDNKLPSGACFDSLNLTITPNGVYPCCNGSEITKYGKLGSLDESLKDILNRNYFLRLLTLIGPSRLLKELKLDYKYKNKEYSSICELCSEILNDDEVYNKSLELIRGRLG